jgi:hypothetical protein
MMMIVDTRYNIRAALRTYHTSPWRGDRNSREEMIGYLIFSYHHAWQRHTLSSARVLLRLSQPDDPLAIGN